MMQHEAVMCLKSGGRCGHGLYPVRRRRAVVAPLVAVAMGLALFFTPMSGRAGEAGFNLDLHFPASWGTTSSPPEPPPEEEVPSPPPLILRPVRVSSILQAAVPPTDSMANESTNVGTSRGRGGMAAQVGKAEIGFETTVNEDLQIYTFPISYHILPYLKAGVVVPWVARHHEIDRPDNPMRNGERANVSGFGDTLLTLGVRHGDPHHLLGITTFILKTPTGDPEAADGDEWVPLGSGSWDFAVYQTLIRRVGDWRGEVTGGYRYNTTGRFNADLTHNGKKEDVTLTLGDVATLLVGVDHDIPGLSAWIGFFKVDTRYVQEADLTINGERQATPSAQTFVDLLPGVKYFFRAGTAVQISLRLPVRETEGRNPILDFTAAYIF